MIHATHKLRLGVNIDHVATIRNGPWRRPPPIHCAPHVLLWKRAQTGLPLTCAKIGVI